MNNPVYGKTMENLNKRSTVKLKTNNEQLLKETAKPTFKSAKIINENLYSINKINELLLLNKPSCVGMCILDLS